MPHRVDSEPGPRAVTEFTVLVRVRHDAGRDPADVARGFIASVHHTYSPNIALHLLPGPDQEPQGE